MELPKKGGPKTVEQLVVSAHLADLSVVPNTVVRNAGIPGVPILDRPAWVNRCAEKVSAALFPKLHEVASFDGRGQAYRPGFSVGLFVAGFQMLSSVLEGIAPGPEPLRPTEQESRPALRQVFGNWHGDVLFDHLIRDGGESFVREVAEYAEKLSLSDMADFLQGQADAVRMMAGLNRRNDATEIYFFMVLYWQVVERLENVDHLHRLLVTVFGRNRVGYDPKRVAQICQRVGKRYRARGRPRKQPQSLPRLR